jgi:multifunctional beta-oxidation protein
MSTKLRFDNQVAVVTGAGNGLGKQYALLLAERGAKVVVNDLGGDIHGASNKPSGQGDKESIRVADVVVQEIKRKGGIAVANYDPVQQGERIIQTAIDSFGRVDIVVNNAGILRDITLRKMTDLDWDTIMDVHLHGTMRTARAAWPYMKKQKYGRIVNTTSASGLFGNFGQSNYAAAKMGIVGLSETLAKEGSKYNILCNVIAPAAASRLTATVLPPDVMQALRPEWVAPLIGALCHSSCSENGSIFEAGAGHFSKIRWERSQGWQCRPEDLTPDLVIQNFAKITDWTDAEHPDGPRDGMKLLSSAKSIKRTSARQASQKPVDFKGRVALVTGAGNGLGRAYALQLSQLGAKVAVLDLQGARKVADEIKAKGGEALALEKSVTEDADTIIAECIQHFGRLDILLNNAGILRDKSFQNMTDELWYAVMDVHLRATFKLTKAAWPHMLKQKYGRIIGTTSTSGIYGNFGQSNYAAAVSILLRETFCVTDKNLSF